MAPSGQPSHRESSTADHLSPAETQPGGNWTGRNEKQLFVVVRKGNWEVTGWDLRVFFVSNVASECFLTAFQKCFEILL